MLNIIKLSLQVHSLNRCKFSILKGSFCKLSSRSNAIITEKLGFVTTIGLNKPDSRNELDDNVFNELCESIKKFENDSSSTSAVLYGIGGNFCIGHSGDIKLTAEKLLSTCKKPIVAALTGYSTGFGFELAMLCDLRVMEATAQIGMNAKPMILSEIFYQRLVGAVGSSLAMDIALTGRNIPPKEALQIGLVNRIVDCGTGVGQGITLAKWVGKYPVEDLVTAKTAVYKTLHK